MTIEKKTIRSDIPGSHVFLNGNIGYVGSTAEEMRRLVVARDISLNGQINACDYLVIEGVVEAEAFSGRRMDILETGLFAGTAEVQDCVIAGRFEGVLTVTGRLTVKPTGQVQGAIAYGTLEVEAGGRLEGQLTSAIPVAPVVVEAPALAALTPPPAPVVNNVEPLFADDDEEKTVTGRAVYRRAARG